MINLILALFGLAFFFTSRKLFDGFTRTWCQILAGIIVIANSFFALTVTVPAGHVKVASLFGSVVKTPYRQGLHFPVNPLYRFAEFDVRQKSYKENAPVPSEDKLMTSIDVSVQYRIIADMAPAILENTGDANALIAIHLQPKLRSILREQGKSVKRAEDFFIESVQVHLQESLKNGLDDFMLDKGILIDSVLIRDIALPQVITDAVNRTKTREQQVLEQQAELQRFVAEQEQKVKTAEAEEQAAESEARKIRMLAEAEAYQIKLINEQLQSSPQYVRLKTVERWDGKLSVYQGGNNAPLIDLR